MNRRIVAALLICAAIVIGVFVQQQKAAKADQLPEPLIKFSGSQVIFAENMPDCH